MPNQTLCGVKEVYHDFRRIRSYQLVELYFKIRRSSWQNCPGLMSTGNNPQLAFLDTKQQGLSKAKESCVQWNYSLGQNLSQTVESADKCLSIESRLKNCYSWIELLSWSWRSCSKIWAYLHPFRCKQLSLIDWVDAESWVEAFFTSILIEGQLDHYFELGMFNIFWSLVRRLTS